MSNPPLYQAADNRYERITYRRCGRRGLKLPAISLGLWQNFGEYLQGIPEDSRVRTGEHFSEQLLSEENLSRVQALNDLAARRDQTLAQMALSWVLRDPRVTSALIGVSSVEQLEDNVAALARLEFDAEELAEVDRSAEEGAINIWAQSSRN